MTTQTTQTEAKQPTVAELMALVQSLQEQVKAKPRTGSTKFKLLAKPNAKQGLFFQVSEIKEHSARTGKDYTPSMNVHNYQIGSFLAVLKNEAYRNAVIEAIEKGKEVRL
jgi:hypothetical protein